MNELSKFINMEVCCLETVEELEELNQSLRQRDKVKDDAIAQLSDQLVALTVRLQDQTLSNRS